VSKLKATVTHCYFRGSHYLIEASYEKGILFFENETELISGYVLFLAKK
jgi:hypothetical protein